MQHKFLAFNTHLSSFLKKTGAKIYIQMLKYTFSHLFYKSEYFVTGALTEIKQNYRMGGGEIYLYK